MTKLKVLKIINIFLFLSALLQAITGLMLFFINQASFINVAAEVHEFNGFALVLLIISHLYLNWQVIVNHYFKKAAA